MDVETLRGTLDRLRLEIVELRASRARLVLAADADRRWIERAMHDSVHQQLIALAVDVQLARRAVDSDLAEAKALLHEMERDVQRALDATALLAQRIYPPLLEARGLGAALRAAATSGGIDASVDVRIRASCPTEVVSTVYLCCLEALDRAGPGATVTVRDEEGGLAFDVEGDRPCPDGALDRLRDRVEALGGRLTVESKDGGGMRVSGSLPLSR
jgi:signal transduction histidine kinase